MASGLVNFDRQYRLAAGPAGGSGFEIGERTRQNPLPLHIDFSFQKTDLESQNTGRVTVWNLNPQHLSIINQADCVLSLRAGYANRLPLIFTGIVSYATTKLDGADHRTEIEVVDNLIEIRDTYVSVSYKGVVNWKKILDDVASQMGVAISYAYNVEFSDVQNGFSYVGRAKEILTKGCSCCGLTWSLQNGVLQVTKPGDVMSREVYILSEKTGLVGLPARVSLDKSASSNRAGAKKQLGWEVEYLLNGAININDFVKLESKVVNGYFRLQSVEHAGDNLSGEWTSKARLLEVS